ncbi:chondroitin proteoglycan 2-like isoform X2 [Actinia tenebrosa]|uniref:Chondroitin proteoglycan 2-like isoform X2 n=1 Tax=Actinia tenebrosa TaxID=6105 RepID=A0A6P8HV96_ACTTE|nr:chondroitin proteoglycan 2-like isoform X2 [Actinia tenebrosa]
MKFLLTILVVIFVSSSAEDMLKELDDELYLDLLQQEGTKDGTVKADDIVGMQWNDKKDDGQNSSSTTFCKDKPNGNYPNPFKCEGFIMCSNHLTYFFDCPSILQYNPKTDRCDWPRNVNCGPAPRPTNTPRPPKPSPSNFCKNRPNGNYVDPNNCNGFIMCSNHLTYFFHCPANLRYNVKTDRCDWPRNVKCGPTPQPTGQPTKSRPTVTPSPSTFCRNRADGNYVDPNNCNGFIMCSNHRTYFFDCPANLRYNAKTDRCDWPRNVKCNSLSDDISSDTNARRSKFCMNHGNGNYRDITNCEGYITCFRGYMFYRECPGTLRFNPLTRRCDLPRNVKCAGAGGGTRGSGFCKKRANGDYKDVLNCNDFIKCSNGYTYYFDCPSDLRFNENTDRCDWPRNVPCNY